MNLILETLNGAPEGAPKGYHKVRSVKGAPNENSKEHKMAPKGALVGAPKGAPKGALIWASKMAIKGAVIGA